MGFQFVLVQSYLKAIRILDLFVPKTKQMTQYDSFFTTNWRLLHHFEEIILWVTFRPAYGLALVPI